MNSSLSELTTILAQARAVRVRRELAAQKDRGPGYVTTGAATHQNTPAQRGYDANEFYQTTS
jgi:hypothetical protein